MCGKMQCYLDMRVRQCCLHVPAVIAKHPECRLMLYAVFNPHEMHDLHLHALSHSDYTEVRKLLRRAGTNISFWEQSCTLLCCKRFIPHNTLVTLT
jgi:hypothetical protein